MSRDKSKSRKHVIIGGAIVVAAAVAYVLGANASCPPPGSGLDCKISGTGKCIHRPGNAAGYPGGSRCHIYSPPSQHP